MNYRKTVMLLAASSLLTMPLMAQHDGHGQPERDFRAELRGRNEVPLTLSAGRGTLSLNVSDDDTSVHFVLEYSGLLNRTSMAA